MTFFLALIFLMYTLKVHSAPLNLPTSQIKKQLNQISKNIKCGDTIRLEEGEYFGVLRLNNLKCANPTIISSDKKNSNAIVSIDSIIISNSSNVIINDLSFRSGDASLHVTSSANVIVKNNKFHGVKSAIPLKIRNSKNMLLLENEFHAKTKEQIHIRKSNKIVFLNNQISLGRHAALQLYPYGSVEDVLVAKNVFSAREGRAVEFFITKNLMFYKNVIEYSGKSQYAKDASSKFMTDTGFFISNTFQYNYGIPVAIFPYKKDSYVKDTYLVGNYFQHNELADIFIGGKVENLENIHIVNNIFDSEPHKFARIQMKTRSTKVLLEKVSITNNYFKKNEKTERLFKSNERDIIHLSEYDSPDLAALAMKNDECQEEKLQSKLNTFPALVTKSLGWLSEFSFEGKEKITLDIKNVLLNLKEEIILVADHVSKKCIHAPNESISQELLPTNENYPVDLLNFHLSWRIKPNIHKLPPIKFTLSKTNEAGYDKNNFLKILSNGEISINLLGKKLRQGITLEMNSSCTNIPEAHAVYYANHINELKSMHKLKITQKRVKKNGLIKYLCTINEQEEMEIKEIIFVVKKVTNAPLIIRSVLLH